MENPPSMLVRLNDAITRGFAILTVAGVAWAWIAPAHFIWFLPWIAPALGFIMLGMGITLGPDDFREVARRPGMVAIGVAAQYGIMPLLGWSVAALLRLPAGLAAGLILVACCPGGTASNVITWLARGQVGLSVVLTACSTLLAAVVTPLLARWLAGHYLPVDAGKLFLDTVQVVLLPVLIGVVLNQKAPKLARPVAAISPSISVLLIILVVGAIVAKNKEAIAASAGVLALAVFLLHAGGFSLGYLLSRLLGHPEPVRRTLAIEVGMQNSGLGATLARHLPDPLAPVPSALSAVCHCLIGSLMAAIWRRKG